jgi:hypothetical protein
MFINISMASPPGISIKFDSDLVLKGVVEENNDINFSWHILINCFKEKTGVTYIIKMHKRENTKIMGRIL